MASLSTIDKRILEKLFQMEEGYVLDFSNRTFQEFFLDEFKIDIYGGKYSYASGSKANRLRAFWDSENNKIVSTSILKLIKYIDTQILTESLKKQSFPDLLIKKATSIANILYSSIRLFDEEEKEFLKNEFNDIDKKITYVHKDASTIIKQRINEIELCIENKIYLGAIFLIGSTLEGFLAELSKKYSKEFCSASSSPKSKDKTININEWKLNSLIDVSYELGFINLNTKKFSHDLKDFRNFIHPKEQLKYNFNPDIHTAKICFQVLKSAINDMQKKITP